MQIYFSPPREPIDSHPGETSYERMSEIFRIFKIKKSTNMGKFTDEYFVFPIKIYDGYSLKKAMKQEEDNETEGPVPVDWVVGHVRIPGRDMYKAIWHDGFSRERTVSEVAEKGFDLTVVLSDLYGDFVCTWPRKKFEAKLDEFMEQYEAEQKKLMSQVPIYMTGFSEFKEGPKDNEAGPFKSTGGLEG